jgi:hypothetical protein
VSRDNYLYVGKKDGRYMIVNRSASLDYDERIEPDEVPVADSTEPSSAVLMANRLQWEDRTEYGVVVSDRVARELGWRLNR